MLFAFSVDLMSYFFDVIFYIRIDEPGVRRDQRGIRQFMLLIKISKLN